MRLLAPRREAPDSLECSSKMCGRVAAVSDARHLLRASARNASETVVCAASNGVDRGALDDQPRPESPAAMLQLMSISDFSFAGSGFICISSVRSMTNMPMLAMF